MKKYFATILLLSSLTCANAGAADLQSLASKGDLPPVTQPDVDAALFFLSPEQRKTFAEQPEKTKPVAEEILYLREWARSPLRASLSAEEQAALAHQRAVADMRYGFDALAQRELRRYHEKLPLLEARAREIWQADQAKYQTDESAEVVFAFIDSVGRGLTAATARYQQILRQVRSGKQLASVAETMTDPLPSTQKKPPIRTTLYKGKVEGASQRMVFEKLKIGEISPPIPVPEGWLVVQVQSRTPSAVRPFESVKQKIMESVLADSSRTDRAVLMSQLQSSPVVYSPLLEPNKPATDSTAAATVSEILNREINQLNLTPDQIQKRMRELLEQYKILPNVPQPGAAPQPSPEPKAPEPALK